MLLSPVVTAKGSILSRSFGCGRPTPQREKRALLLNTSFYTAILFLLVFAEPQMIFLGEKRSSSFKVLRGDIGKELPGAMFLIDLSSQG